MSRTKSSIARILPGIEFSEGYSVEIVVDEDITGYANRRCPHVDTWGRLPRGVRAYNEGGSNHTLVCLDCLMQVAGEL